MSRVERSFCISRMTPTNELVEALQDAGDELSLAAAETIIVQARIIAGLEVGLMQWRREALQQTEWRRRVQDWRLNQERRTA